MTGLNKQQMRDQIRRINRIDFSKSNYNTVKSIVNSMIEGISAVVGTTKSHELFFRARISNQGKINSIEDLYAPPPHLVTGFQRCNAPGSPMLYCASRRLTALLECNAQKGDKVYLSQFIGKEEIPVNKVLDADIDKEFFDRLDDREDIFYSFMDTFFTKKVPRDFSHEYMISAAISEILTSGFKKEDERKIWADGRVGLRYPSVYDLENSYNTAFPPEFANTRLDILHVMELEILDRKNDDISVRLSDAASSFDGHRIEWTGTTSILPAPRDKDGGVPFRFNGKKWEVLTTEHLAVPAEATHPLLNELLKE